MDTPFMLLVLFPGNIYGMFESMLIVIFLNKKYMSSDALGKKEKGKTKTNECYVVIECSTAKMNAAAYPCKQMEKPKLI